MMRMIPKALAAVALSAAAGTANAQSEATLRAALQRAAVVEEQEHDLRAAVELCRQVARDAEAAQSLQVRGEALLRLGELLRRLGKDDEARAALEQAAALGGAIGERAKAALEGQGQAGEREQKLREKARAILEGLLQRLDALYRAGQPGAGPAPGPSGPATEILPGIPDPQAVQDLLWIGQPAVPEVLRALERLEAEYAELVQGHEPTYLAEPSRSTDTTQWQITGMMALLWKLGGGYAARYLEQVQQHELMGMRRAAAYAAHVADDPRMIEVAQGFLQDPDPEGQVPIAVLSKSWKRSHGGFAPEHHGLYQALPVRAIVDLLESEVAAVRVHVLDLLREHWPALRHDPDPESTSELLVPKLRDALEGLHPQVGQVAQRLLVSEANCASSAGRSLLLEWIPRLDESLNPSWGDLTSLLPSGGTVHLDEILRTARALGPAELKRSGNQTYIVGRHGLLWNFVAATQQIWGHDALQGVLELVTLGYDVPGGAFLSSWVRVNAKPDDLLLVAKHLPHYGAPVEAMRVLASPSLPAEAWPHLRDYAEARDQLSRTDLEAIGWTGATEAAEFLLAHVRTHPESYDDTVEGLLNLSHENQGDEVRAVLRQLLVMSSSENNQQFWRNAVFARLAQLGVRVMGENRIVRTADSVRDPGLLVPDSVLQPPASRNLGSRDADS